jgi:hypothetical protein
MQGSISHFMITGQENYLDSVMVKELKIYIGYCQILLEPKLKRIIMFRFRPKEKY